MVQIETKEAINKLDEILSVEGVDVAFIGPLDLSVSLGVPRQWTSNILKKSIQKVIKKCKEYDIIAGIDAQDIENARNSIQQGFRFITFSSDTDFLFSAAKETYTKLLTHQHIKPEEWT